MNTARQQLHREITPDDLNERLEAGARIVWIDRNHGDRFDVVLETYVESEHVPELIVLDFLAHVPVGTLEERMLDGADLGTSVGQSAINALAAMVKVPGS